MMQRAKVIRDIVLTSVVLHYILRTHQDGQDKAPTTADDIAASANEPIVYVPVEVADDNFVMTHMGVVLELLESVGCCG